MKFIPFVSLSIMKVAICLFIIAYHLVLSVMQCLATSLFHLLYHFITFDLSANFMNTIVTAPFLLIYACPPNQKNIVLLLFFLLLYIMYLL